jgi:hypothetical protein
MPFVDFAELKTRVAIEQAMQMLGLNLTLHGNQYRGACPVCKAGGDRALIVTPAKGLFYSSQRKPAVTSSRSPRTYVAYP